MWCKSLHIIVVFIAICSVSAGFGGFTVSHPAATDDLNPAMTVECAGTGTDMSDVDLELRIYTDGTYKNHGDGDHIGMSGTWEGDVPPPTGGFGTGTGTLKVWKASQNPALDPPEATGTFDFVIP